MRHVLFARPDQLDGPLHRHRDDQRLLDEIGEQPAAEAAADQRAVDDDLVARQAGHLRGDDLRHLDALGRRPDLAHVRRHPRRAVHRLHGGVRLERRRIGHRDGGGAGRRGIAFGQMGKERPARHPLGIDRREPGRARERAALLAPGKRRAIERQARLPVGFCRDRDAVRHRHDGDDARLRQKRVAVERCQRRAEPRRGAYGRDHHVGQPHVDAEFGAAVDLAGNVPAPQRAPGRRRIGARHRVRRHRKLAGLGGDRAIAQPLRAVHQVAVAQRDRGGRHLPARGRGRDQHVARRRAHAAHHRIERRRALAVAGEHPAVDRIAIGRIVGREFNPHTLERNVELVGQHRRKRRAAALPHLGLRRHQRDRVVGRDAHPCGERHRCTAGRRRGARASLGHQRCGDQQCTAGDELAARRRRGSIAWRRGNRPNSFHAIMPRALQAMAR